MVARMIIRVFAQGSRRTNPPEKTPRKLFMMFVRIFGVSGIA